MSSKSFKPKKINKITTEPPSVRTRKASVSKAANGDQSQTTEEKAANALLELLELRTNELELRTNENSSSYGNNSNISSQVTQETDVTEVNEDNTLNRKLQTIENLMTAQNNDSLRQAAQERQKNKETILHILEHSHDVFDIIKERAIKQSEFLIDMYEVTNFRKDIKIIIDFQVNAINYAKQEITTFLGGRVLRGVKFENDKLNNIKDLLVRYLNIDTSSHNDICRRLSDKEGFVTYVKIQTGITQNIDGSDLNLISRSDLNLIRGILGFVELKYLKDFRTKKYSDIITESPLIQTSGNITFIGYYVYRDVCKFMKCSADTFMRVIRTTANTIHHSAGGITDVIYSETPMLNLLNELSRFEVTVKKTFFSLFSGNILSDINNSVITGIRSLTKDSEIIQLTLHMIDIMSDKNKSDPILMSLSPSMTNEQTEIIQDYADRTVPNNELVIELGIEFKNKIVEFIKVAIEVHKLKDIVEEKRNRIVSNSSGSSFSQDWTPEPEHRLYNSNSNNKYGSSSQPIMGGKKKRSKSKKKSHKSNKYNKKKNTTNRLKNRKTKKKSRKSK